MGFFFQADFKLILLIESIEVISSSFIFKSIGFMRILVQCSAGRFMSWGFFGWIDGKKWFGDHCRCYHPGRFSNRNTFSLS